MMSEAANISNKMTLLHQELSIHMYDLPPIEDFPLSAICKIAEDRIHLLKGIQSYFENRKEENDRETGFYEGLAERFATLTNRYRILEDPFTDRLSHWMLKLTFTNS